MPISLRGLAKAIIDFATALLPPSLRPWGAAMGSEVETIERADQAFMFAMGCLGFALQQALIFYVLHPLLPTLCGDVLVTQETKHMTIFQSPRQMTGLCAIIATSLGLVYMGLAGATGLYLAMNAGALVIGFLIVGAVASGVRVVPMSTGFASILFGVALLLTSLFGVRLEGVARWVAFGGLVVQLSFLIIPVMAICFAASRDRLSMAGIVIASFALAMQPDKAMSGALAAGIAAIAILKPERNVLIALAAALTGFIITLVRADTLPAMPYVEHILFSSFQVHSIAGVAVWLGVAVMIVPAVYGYFNDVGRRETYAVFGAIWLSIIIAAAVGNYPTPVVGYGGSAIIGYVVCLIGLPKRTNFAPFKSREVLSSPLRRDQDSLRTRFS